MNAAPIRVLSVNACCLPSGLRNHALPLLTGGSSIGLFLLLWLLFSTWLLSTRPAVSSLLIALLSMVPCFLVGHTLGVQAARLVGGFLRLVTGDHDFKRERLAALADLLAGYDVVAVQECFEAAPRCLDGAYAQELIELAAARGFIHVKMASPARLPSLAMGSGLLILSRYPIVSSHELVFSTQAAFERYAVNRSAMHTRIQLPQEGFFGEQLDFFTVHISPALGSGLVTGLPQARHGSATRGRPAGCPLSQGMRTF